MTKFISFKILKFVEISDKKWQSSRMLSSLSEVLSELFEFYTEWSSLLYVTAEILAYLLLAYGALMAACIAVSLTLFVVLCAFIVCCISIVFIPAIVTFFIAIVVLYALIIGCVLCEILIYSAYGGRICFKFLISWKATVKFRKKWQINQTSRDLKVKQIDQIERHAAVAAYMCWVCEPFFSLVI